MSYIEIDLFSIFVDNTIGVTNIGPVHKLLQSPCNLIFLNSFIFTLCWKLSSSRVGAHTLYTCIREVSCSYLGRITDCPHWCISLFSHSLYEHFGTD